MGSGVGQRERAEDALMSVTSAPPGSVAAVLQQAMAERGVSIHWVLRELTGRGVHLDPATLMNWRAGRLIPGPQESATVRLLEEVLGVDEGSLGGVQGGGPDGLSDAPRPSVPQARGPSSGGESLDRALTALGFDGPPALVPREVRVVLQLDDRGIQRSVTRRTTWQAERDGARAFPAVTALPAPVTARPTITPVLGCSLGPEYTDLGDGVYGATLELDRALSAGETAVTELCTEFPEGLAEDRAYQHQLLRQVDHVEVVVRFHPDRIPSTAHAFICVDDRESARVLPVVGTELAHRLQDFGPGEIGVRWRW